MTYSLCHQKRIDYLGRVLIPKEICKMAKIECNDNLNITYNEQEDSIIIKKVSNNKEILDVIRNVFYPFAETIGCLVVVTDSSKVVEVINGSKKNDYKGKDISDELKNIILDQYNSSKIIYNLRLTNELEINSKCYYISIKKNDYNIGSAIIVTDEINKDLFNFILKQVRR